MRLVSTSAIFDSGHQIQIGAGGDFRWHREPHDGEGTPAGLAPPGSRHSWRQPDRQGLLAGPEWRKSRLAHSVADHVADAEAAG